MEGSKTIREFFKEYGGEVDASLRSLFETMPKYCMYGHMAYFMGFADEDLNPIELYGGKRFRSSMCLMLAEWYGAREAAQSVATSLELYHNFTLIHDDIIDEDTLRRGRKTVWNIWGIPQTINSGDGQALLAYRVLGDNKHLPAERTLLLQRFLTAQYQKVIEGQYLDLIMTDVPLDDEIVTEEAYFEMIGRKTAELIAASTKSAGMVAGVSKTEEDALYEYGYNLGIAYQLCDDTVSIWGTEEQTGKRAYGDVLERKKTLPILYALTKLDSKAKGTLVSYYGEKGTISGETAELIVALLDSVDTYSHMSELVSEYATKTKKVVDSLSLQEDEKETLRGIVDALLPDIKAM